MDTLAEARITDDILLLWEKNRLTCGPEGQLSETEVGWVTADANQ
jgi:hypothetical protein